MKVREQERKPKRIRSDIGHTETASMAELGAMARRNPEAFLRKARHLIQDGRLAWSNIGSLREAIKELAPIQVRTHVNLMGSYRSITTSMFPILAGALTEQAFNEAYDRVPQIGDQLVRDVETNKKVTHFTRLAAQDKAMKDVEEGEPFPLLGSTSDWVTATQKRRGARIAITAETVEETDSPADLVNQIDQLAEIAGDTIEEQTLSRVCDVYGSAASAAYPYVYNPKGAGAALFSSTANTPGTRAPSGTRVENNAFQDQSDLDAMRDLLVAMKNDRGRRIGLPWSEVITLVPDALAGKVGAFFDSELMPGNPNEINPYGPKGRYRGRLLSSPKLDDFSTSAMYMGRPQKQFRRVWKLRMEYVSLTGDPVAYLVSRIWYQARIAWSCEVTALDYIYWVQSLAASASDTAANGGPPSDPFDS